MAEAGAMPSFEEVMGWVGAKLTDLEGGDIGQVQGFFVDGDSGAPAWLIARLGRRRGSRVVAVPMGGCAGAPFGVWAAYEAEAIRTAPIVDPTRPLRCEHELTICTHYGIGGTVGRAAEVAARHPENITATPAR
jgi:hypothetical protein